MIKPALMISVAAAALAAAAGAAGAQDVLKLGLVQSMTGALNTTGKAVVNGALLYLKQHGDMVAARDGIDHMVTDVRRRQRLWRGVAHQHLFSSLFIVRGSRILR